LTETLTQDVASGDVVGQIEVLRLLAQGPTEDATRKLLAEIFVEFCEVEIGRGGFSRLLLTLVQRGFVVSTERAGRGHTPQYLQITEAEHGGGAGKFRAEMDPAGAKIGTERELAGV